MLRRLAAVALGVAALLLMAVPAQAKGPGDTLSGTAIITGPGLEGPIKITQTRTQPPAGGAEVSSDEVRPPTRFESVLFATGLLGSDAETGWYTLDPDPKTLGPRYRIVWDLSGFDGESAHVIQYVYPFAKDRPLFETPDRQHVFGRPVAEWFSTSPAVLLDLQELGLPRTPPGPAAPAAAAKPQPAHGQPVAVNPWIFLLTGIPLVALFATMAARRRKGTVTAA
jgi:hypothetical protein